MSIVEYSRLYAALPDFWAGKNRAVIDLAALRHNYRVLRARAGGRTCICVVKAEAYGHGMAEVGRALFDEGCRTFAVSCLGEALALREAVADADILIFGQTPPESVSLLVQHNLTATVYSIESARELAAEAARLGVILSVHIKLDTGMNRLGFAAYSEKADGDAVSAVSEVFSMKNLKVNGIYSHFAKADEADEADTRCQAERFLSMTGALEARGFSLGMRHICNSAGAMRFADEYGMDAVRLGFALYGYHPDATVALDLRPVMRLESEITHLHTLLPHERVGYGGTFESDAPRLVATIGIGYADGWLRAYTGARVTVHTEDGDFSVPVIGRICMDQCMIDVSDLPVKRGDRVTLFGQNAAELESLAKMAKTIPYECLCLISSRVPRVVKK